MERDCRERERERGRRRRRSYCLRAQKHTHSFSFSLVRDFSLASRFSLTARASGNDEGIKRGGERKVSSRTRTTLKRREVCRRFRRCVGVIIIINDLLQQIERRFQKCPSSCVSSYFWCISSPERSRGSSKSNSKNTSFKPGRIGWIIIAMV